MSGFPNIIVIMTDQQKATASHLYGNTFCETPAMARLAEDGVLFEHAFTPHPLCVPARISLWTAQFPHAHGGRRNETWMSPETNHAFKLWQEAGYHTGLIGKNHCFQPADLAFFDTWCEIGHRGLPDDPGTKGLAWFRPLENIHAAHTVRRNMPSQNPYFDYASSDFPLKDYSTGLVAGQTAHFLEQHQHEPFALWVSFPDPHAPYEAPEEYVAMFPPDKIELPPWRDNEFDDHAPERNRVMHQILGFDNGDIPLAQVYGVLAAYYGMVRFIDDGLGQILDALERLGLREKTIVVFCSDHGDFAGEHQMQGKGGVFYDCLTRVPLIVSWPGHIPAGQRDGSMVNLIDIVPTLFHLQGLNIPHDMQGDPLPTITKATPRPVAFSEYGAGGPAFHLNNLAQLSQPYGRKAIMDSLQWREAEGRRKMVRTQQWKYVHDPMGDRDELYDLVNDSWELKNVIDDPQHTDVLTDLQLRLADWSIQTEDSKAVPLP